MTNSNLSILRGEPGAFPADLDPAALASTYDKSDLAVKKGIARQWLNLFNGHWVKFTDEGLDKTSVLHAMISQYYQWIAKIAPVVEKHWFTPEEFDATLAALIRLTGSIRSTSFPARYIQIVHQLWFENPENPQDLLGEIYTMCHEGTVQNTGYLPSDSAFWGMLVANLMWDVTKKLPIYESPPYVAMASWVSAISALVMPEPLSHHHEKQALIWHAMMWHTVNDRSLDIHNYAGMDIQNIIKEVPITTKIIVLSTLINVSLSKASASTDTKTPLAQAVDGVFDTYSALKAWTIGLEKEIMIAQATGLSAWEFADYILDLPVDELSPQKAEELPDDLVGA